MGEIGGLLQERHRAEREHQERQALRAQEHDARAETDEGRHERREDQPGDRLVPDAVLGQHAHRVGARAEERGVTERHDARVAEHQVEREREEDRDQDLGTEAQVFREGEVERQREQPGDRLPRA